jgi:hypothetical protein
MRSLNPFRALKRRSTRRYRGIGQPVNRPLCYRYLSGECLEQRTLLVIGAFDIPLLEAGSGYDGVARINRGTGALLSTGRHVLTAAHVSINGPAPANFWVTSPTGVRKITSPADDFTVPPGYPQAAGADDFDIGVTTLAELAPLTADRWDIYTDSDEVGKVGRLVGYGGTGTGTIGHSTDVNPDEYWSTSTGTGTNYEVVRFTITGNPTGGFFYPRLSNDVPPVQPAVPFNTDADILAASLNSLPDISQVLVRLVGDTDFDGVVDNLSHPHAGSFEVLFRGTSAADHSLPGQLIATHDFTGGNNPDLLVERLLIGGTQRILTSGRNLVSLASSDGTRLYTDFDDGTAAASTFGGALGQGASEAHGTWGDSGSPLFIGGKIAGVLEGLYNSVEGFSSGGGYDGLGGSGDFGEIDSWARVSFHENFINNILDDPFPLVLNMANQPWGDDGTADTIEISSVFGSLQIRIGGVLYYTESLNLIESVTVQGSGDDETIMVSAFGDGIPVQVVGGGGDDLIRVDGLSSDTLAILFGSAGSDTFSIGDGDFDSSINGNVWVFGDADSDTLVLDDQQGGGNHTYTLEDDRFTMSSYPGTLLYFGVENVHLQANEDDNTINIASTALNSSLSVSANSGNDTIRVGGGDIDSNIRGDVDVHGGFGNDVLVLQDVDDDIGNDEHTLHASTYSKTDYQGVLSFNFVNDIRLRTGANRETVHLVGTAEDVTDVLVQTDGGDDTVNVYSVHLNTAVDIRTRAGNDTVEFSPYERDLDAIAGQVSVNAGAGAADELRVFDNDDDGNDLYSISATSVSEAGFQASHAQVERLTLWANPFANTINVESLGTRPEVVINAGDGPDSIHLAPTSQTLADIRADVLVNGEDGDDEVFLHDASNGSPAASLTIQDGLVTRPGFALHYEDVARLSAQLGAPADSVLIPSTTPGMHVIVDTGDGPDAVSANVPSGARLTLNGGTGADAVWLTGTPAAEEISVSAGLGSADVNLIRFEQAQIDLLGGDDTLQFQGIAGADEQVEAHASPTSAAGLLRVVGLLDLAFASTELIDLLANLGEGDTAAFLGTAQADEFAIDLAAEGTNADPVIELFDPASLALLLTLRDYRNFGTLGVLGQEEGDLVNVSVAPAGPGSGRNLRIDGGEPAGQGSGKDELNVFFQAPPPPTIDHTKDNMTNSGMFDVDYELWQFLIEYFDMEKAKSLSSAGA